MIMNVRLMYILVDLKQVITYTCTLPKILNVHLLNFNEPLDPNTRICFKRETAFAVLFVFKF